MIISKNKKTRLADAKFGLCIVNLSGSVATWITYDVIRKAITAIRHKGGSTK